jgi:hypothetical protein
LAAERSFPKKKTFSFALATAAVILPTTAGGRPQEEAHKRNRKPREREGTRAATTTHTAKMGKKTKAVNNKQSTGIDFIRAKKKVGRTIKKSNNETNTTVVAKRINLPGQSVGVEHKGAAVTGRGLSMPELLNQTQHYSARVRKDALDGIKELLTSHPECLRASAATVVEKVAERLVDQEQVGLGRWHSRGVSDWLRGPHGVLSTAVLYHTSSRGCHSRGV